MLGESTSYKSVASSALRMRVVKNSIISNKLSASMSMMVVSLLKRRMEGDQPTLVHRVDVSNTPTLQAISMVVSINVLGQLPVVSGVY